MTPQEATPASTDDAPPAAESAGASEATESANDDIPEYEPLTPELVEDEAIRGDFVLRWSVVLMAFLVGSTKLADSVTLVHIKSGQYMASHGVLPPRTDVFSYTLGE